MRKLLTQYPRGITFKTKGYLMNGQIWHSIHKKMHMVWVYLQSYHLYAKLTSFLLEQRIKSILNLIHQYFSPPPRNPDEMIVDQGDRMPFMSIFLPHKYIKHILRKEAKGKQGAFLP